MASTATTILPLLQAALGDRYRVEREIGAGGMALVFLAQDQKLNRRVALKLLRPELSATLGTDRFLREIRLAAGLQHPHIVPVHDCGEREGYLYYVMAYVEGESLRDRLVREGRLDAAGALRIAKGVAAALEHAHRRGIVHRDVKPENILLSEGEAFVTDFGIAKAVASAGDASLTQAGSAVGTPAYMSPEQIAGDADLDGRSDIFSLGCVAFEMLAGAPPFSGETAQAVMAKRFTATAPTLRSRPGTAAVPEGMARAIDRALQRRPADRFATASEFAEALSSAGGAEAPPAATGAKSIAVLPFRNLSTDPENECFSDGISEEIINALARVPTLRIAARTSSFAFKGKSDDVRVIGERLNVSTVLEGSVRRAASRLRVTAQLVDAADGYQLWSESYDREFDDVFKIQDEIATAIVDTLKVRLLSEPGAALVRPPTENVEAYALYLRGRYYWAKRNEVAVKKGIGFFERAIAIDPGYARALVGIADSYNILGFYDLRPPREVFPHAHEAARRALQMDPTLAEAHAAEGYAFLYYDWDWEASEREFERAIELDPRYATALQFFANLRVVRGRFDEAIDLIKRARELEPLALIMVSACGFAHYCARNYDEAITCYRSALALDEHFLIAHWWLSLTFAEMGRLGESVDAAERAVAISQRNPTMVAALARAHALAGRDREARALLAELAESGKRRFVSSYELAQVRAALGERDTAFELLERAYEERSHSMAFLGVDPRLDPLVADPRFAPLLARVGF